VCKTERLQERKAQRACAQPGTIARAARAGFRYMTERIGPFIAIITCIFSAAAPDRIHDDEKGACHLNPSPYRDGLIRY
jgi:hypothetical protein